MEFIPLPCPHPESAVQYSTSVMIIPHLITRNGVTYNCEEWSWRLMLFTYSSWCSVHCRHSSAVVLVVVCQSVCYLYCLDSADRLSASYSRPPVCCNLRPTPLRYVSSLDSWAVAVTSVAPHRPWTDPDSRPLHIYILRVLFSYDRENRIS